MLNFNVTGNERKRLVKKLEALIGERAVYQGMPSMGFKIGEYEVSKTGEVTPNLSDDIVNALARAGFTAESEETAQEEEPVGITITVSTEGLSDSAIVNFKNMTESKAELIKEAFGVRELPIEVNEDVLTVKWFEGVESGNAQHAATFVSAMLDKAGQQRYVNPKPLETDNPKYSFRVFLNSLGFKGPEHKQLRTDLLANLSGSTAWRHGKPERSAV